MGLNLMNLKTVNIAVVNDDASYACALEQRLRASGFAVRTYPSAEAFLAATALPPPDCLVLEAQLRGMSGLDLQRQLRQLGALTPVIFVAANDAPRVREEAEQAGCSAFFHKPVGGQLLVETITQAIGRSL
jgi:FixJ family two-component response regulator